MHITATTLPTRSLVDIAAAYSALDLPVVESGAEVRVTIGSSVVVFREDQGFEGTHHLAFTIPTGSLADAKRWLGGRAVLLTRDGADEFEGPDSWDSRSVYFDGPDGQVLEFIERRRLANGIDHAFSAADVVSVSEVGMAVPDVVGAARRFADAGVLPFGGDPTAAFGAVGDEDGLLVLVAPGRTWLPTFERVVADVPVTVAADVVTTVEPAPGKVLVAAAHPRR